MPMFNWEELGKINPDLLRTMRLITFGQFNPSYDGAFFGKKKKMYGEGEVFLHELDEKYKVYDVKERTFEEWPSEKWNYQDKFALKNLKSMKVPMLKKNEAPVASEEESLPAVKISNEDLEELLTSVKGIGNKKLKKMTKRFSHLAIINILENEPKVLKDIKGVKENTIEKLVAVWDSYKETFLKKAKS
jgi:hypothetical protein